VGQKSGKIVAILQSNYIPWKGYFDIIASCDEFVLFDDVQFTRRDWRNRNIIVNVGKPLWLTIPVAKSDFEAPINAITIADKSWTTKHWLSLRHAYGKAPFFKTIGPQIEAIYAKAADLDHLSAVNALFLRSLCDMLDIHTPFSRSEDVPRVAEDPTGRLVEICVARGAALYVSGPAARSYIQKAQFDAAGVALAYADYSGYPVYDQDMDPFEHGVSMLDLLFRFGPAAREQLKTVSGSAPFLNMADA
jgi:hypothetical protein